MPAGHDIDCVRAQAKTGVVPYDEGVVTPGLVYVPAAHGEQTRLALAVAGVAKYVPSGHVALIGNLHSVFKAPAAEVVPVS